ncbi:hypothetical protein H2203_007634 [Taxawa tesnikishii (nom. ined.)]|nr:hypothetical protein H2203_007634 [Dothideales sp. JES 119]
MSILDKVPDIIKEAAVQAGGTANRRHGYCRNEGSINLVSPELVDAFKKGDYNTIQQYTDKATNDLAPIWDNIRVHGKQAFIEVINKSDGVRYQLSPAGRNGWVWVYTKPNGPSGPIESDTLGDQPSFDHVVQLGSFSANSKTLGISDQLWSNTTLQLAAGAVSAIFMMTFSSFIKSRIGELRSKPPPKPQLRRAALKLRPQD